MPISDSDEYPQGHFSRVYEHIIKPACELAGFRPIRADDIMTTNYIALDVIKNIIDCDMAICDLSSLNPNVLYELGIRQSFNLPVTLIKDTKTKRIFDIQGFRDVEYDESLRIDTVETTVEDLSQVLKNTHENKSIEINSLISLLGIEPAKISDKTKISADTELILNSLTSLEKRLTQIEMKPKPVPPPIPTIFPVPEDVGEPLTPLDIDALKIGDQLFHPRFGKGTIATLRPFSGSNSRKIAQIKFENGVPRQVVVQADGNFRKIK